MIYRLHLEDGKVFGAQGKDQEERGMPVPPAKMLTQGKYWLTRAGWEAFGSYIHDAAAMKFHDLLVESADDPHPNDVLYHDIFQIIVRRKQTDMPPKDRKKKKS